MANNNLTTYQRLSIVLGDDNAITPRQQAYNVSDYNLGSADTNRILFRTTDKGEYDTKRLELSQEKYLASAWVRTVNDVNLSNWNNLSDVLMMYRDADLMDTFPEVGAALSLVAEEATTLNSEGKMLNIYSSSDRIKSILEDLFINRLDIQMRGPMIIRSMCKYGNDYDLLNINKKEGVKGWSSLPVYEMERRENGLSVYGIEPNSDKIKPTVFVRNGKNTAISEFEEWQIAHFRLLTDSQYLPYGVSYLNSGRRHFRMLALMEDMMLIYRLERSIERRVFKIFVGDIDDNDVKAYVEQVANRFKRTPIVDPQTGQLDLRKNILAASDDYFIPVRDASASNPIETLQSAQNLTAMDDIKFVQNKLFTALRIPKSFISFEEEKGDGKNLALLDVRFARTVNRIQQAFISELTRIATIHLYLLGFTEDLTNFSITMNNASTQAETLELENLQKKAAIIRDLVSDPGGGIPIMSLRRAQKTVLHWSDSDVAENLGELRLESALRTELEKTPQIIKRTGIFDDVDREYGEPDAEYQEVDPEGGPDGPGGGAPSGGGGGGFGGGLADLGGDEGTGDIEGEEGEMNPSDIEGASEGPAPEGAEGPAPQPEAAPKQESKKPAKAKKPLNEGLRRPKPTDPSVMVNEAFDAMLGSIDRYTNF